MRRLLSHRNLILLGVATTFVIVGLNNELVFYPAITPKAQEIAVDSFDVSPVKPRETTDNSRKENSQITNTVSEEAIVEEMPDQLKALIRSGQPEKVMAHFAEQREVRAKLMQATMAREGVDHMWEEDVKHIFTVGRQLVPQLREVSISAVDCRESICALDIAYGDNLQYKNIKTYFDSLGNVLGADTFIHHDAYAHGGIIYLSREGKQLPEIAVES